MAPTTSDDDHPLWAWSLRTYASPPVAELCLVCQDEHGLDVNLLLLCLWSGFEGPGELGREILAACLTEVHDWQRQVIRPMRALRRELKRNLRVPPEDNERVRDAIASAELQAEQVEQALLARRVAALPPRPTTLDGRTAAMANLERYVELAGVRPSAFLTGRLTKLVAAAAQAAASGRRTGQGV